MRVTIANIGSSIGPSEFKTVVHAIERPIHEDFAPLVQRERLMARYARLVLALFLVLAPTRSWAGEAAFELLDISPSVPANRYPTAAWVTLTLHIEIYTYSGHPNETAWLAVRVHSSGEDHYFLSRAQGVEMIQGMAIHLPKTAGKYSIEYTKIPLWLTDDFDRQLSQAHDRATVGTGSAGTEEFGTHTSGDQPIAVDLDEWEPLRAEFSKVLARQNTIWRPITMGRHDSRPLVVTVEPNAVTSCRDKAVYLRLGGSPPIAPNTLVGGVIAKPPRLSWFVDKPEPGVEFQSKIFPDDQDWSEWSATQEQYVFFLPPGRHEFMVKARWPHGSEWCTTPPATYSFTLDTPLVSHPDADWIAKAGYGAVKAPAPTGPLYGRSVALLVGVSTYRDPVFSQLPQVSVDLDEMQAALLRENFEVRVLRGKVGRAEVLTEIDDIANEQRPYDRVIVYFSGHGFEDPRVPGTAYIATTNCSQASPTVDCLSLESIRAAALGRIAPRTKQVLLITDNCVSGLGLVSKVGSYPNVGIVATRPSVAMLAAGVGQQLANIEGRMSMMTQALVEGLSGKADYTKDEYISMSELLVYVQYEVATRTQGAQVPSLGRLQGDGEMIFTVIGG